MSDDTSTTDASTAGDASTDSATTTDTGTKELSPEELKSALAAARADAAKYRTKLREAEPLVAAAKAAEDAKRTEAEKFATESARATAAETSLAKIRAALAAGLDVSLADRLVGKTAEEYVTDAKALAEKFGAKPTVSRKPTTSLTAGASAANDGTEETDPAKIADRISKLGLF